MARGFRSREARQADEARVAYIEQLLEALSKGL